MFTMQHFLSQFWPYTDTLICASLDSQIFSFQTQKKGFFFFYFEIAKRALVFSMYEQYYHVKKRITIAAIYMMKKKPHTLLYY